MAKRPSSRLDRFIIVSLSSVWMIQTLTLCHHRCKIVCIENLHARYYLNTDSLCLYVNIFNKKSIKTSIVVLMRSFIVHYSPTYMKTYFIP
uniref:Putative secreted protein n=1 Tax=Xenopsylla cheopis TaxID=163159 RepID=A0A6M2E002_XENCH